MAAISVLISPLSASFSEALKDVPQKSLQSYTLSVNYASDWVDFFELFFLNSRGLRADHPADTCDVRKSEWRHAGVSAGDYVKAKVKAKEAGNRILQQQIISRFEKK